jgi:DNA polymerase (family 10)
VALLQSLPEVDSCAPAGSLRRGVEMVDALEIVAGTADAARVGDALATLTDVDVVERQSDMVVLAAKRELVTVRCVPPASAAHELLLSTGSEAHLAQLRERAARRGYRLAGEPPLAPGRTMAGLDEPAIYAAIGLPYIPPELRNGDDEFAAAEQGWMPRLVSSEDICGDLHMHSLWSDGHDGIEAMVVAAVALGYEYIAITDHSQNSPAVRNLSLDGIDRQAEEIAAVRETYPQLTILHGCEVDILEDGHLDFPDRALEQLDIVLASLHASHGHDADMLLRRYEQAMRHPLVSVITHPTNRAFPNRPGYDLDYDRLFRLAVETGTLLEIDGSPSHLDLDAPLARRASEAGVMFTIDSDCHRSNRLARQMHLGLATARRGWVQAERVLNTRPLAEVRARIAAKRSGRVG